MKKRLTPGERWIRDNARLDRFDVADFYMTRSRGRADVRERDEDSRAALETLRRIGAVQR